MPDGIYDEAERKVFGTQINGESRYFDPMMVHRRLTLSLGGKASEILEASTAEDPLARAVAEEKLWPATRAAFQLPALDSKTGQGVTDATCQRILDEFLSWLSQKKMTTAPLPTGSPPTAVSRGRAGLITQPTSHSG